MTTVILFGGMIRDVVVVASDVADIVVVAAFKDVVAATLVDVAVVGAISVMVTLLSIVLLLGASLLWTQPRKSSTHKTAGPKNPVKEFFSSILIMYRLSNLKENRKKVKKKILSLDCYLTCYGRVHVVHVIIYPWLGEGITVDIPDIQLA